MFRECDKVRRGLGLGLKTSSRRVQALDEDKDFIEQSRISQDEDEDFLEESRTSQDEDKLDFQEINKVLFISRVWVEKIFIKTFLINMRINI